MGRLLLGRSNAENDRAMLEVTNCEWMVLLSGQDYPIRPVTEIEASLFSTRATRTWTSAGSCRKCPAAARVGPVRRGSADATTLRTRPCPGCGCRFVQRFATCWPGLRSGCQSASR